MNRIYKIGRKGTVLFQQLEKELIEAAIDDEPMQYVLDDHLNEIIAFYNQLNKKAEKLFQFEDSYEYVKKLLYASFCLKAFIEKILFHSKNLTNLEIFIMFFEEGSLDFSILTEFKKVFDFEELPF
jgi:hypothetical protein